MSDNGTEHNHESIYLDLAHCLGNDNRAGSNLKNDNERQQLGAGNQQQRGNSQNSSENVFQLAILCGTQHDLLLGLLHHCQHKFQAQDNVVELLSKIRRTGSRHPY